MFEEFKKFAMRGNVVDMAVGIIIGGAFGTIVKSLVSDVIMPPIGLLLGGVDFADWFITLKEGATAGPYVTVAAAKEAGAVTLNAGLFINSMHQFPDRCLCRISPDQGNEFAAEEGRGSAGRAYRKGLPTLLHGDPNQGNTLPALYQRAQRIRGMRLKAVDGRLFRLVPSAPKGRADLHAASGC